MNLEAHAGRQAWIEARAAVLVLLRGMTDGAALAQAREEFQRFERLDQKRDRFDMLPV